MRGTTLLLDLAFPAFPDNMGHWTEAIVPVYNVLSAGAWRAALPDQATASAPHIDTLLFVNLRKEHLAVSASSRDPAVALPFHPRLLDSLLVQHRTDKLPAAFGTDLWNRVVSPLHASGRGSTDNLSEAARMASQSRLFTSRMRCRAWTGCGRCCAWRWRRGWHLGETCRGCCTMTTWTT